MFLQEASDRNTLEPIAFDDVFRSSSFCYYLVAEHDTFGLDEQVKWISKKVVVNDRVFTWVSRFQLDGAG